MAKTYDIHLAELSYNEASGTKIFSFTSDTIENNFILVSGIWSVRNKWLLALFTPKYSDPLDLEYGTNFYQLVQSAGDPKELFDSIHVAVQDANESLKRVQLSVTIDPSQRFKNAVLKSIYKRIDDDGYDIYVQISNMTNESIKVSLPVLLGL